MNKFLVLFSDKFFYCRRTPASVVVGTLYNSVGLRMDYLVALDIAAKLRVEGYSDAVVATVFGDPVKPSDLALSAEKLIEEAETAEGVAEAWGADPETSAAPVQAKD
jgi:hypothetical protein